MAKVLMKNIILCLLLLASASFISACSSTSSAAKELVGQQAPFTRFTMLDGSPLVLDEYRGKKVVLMFWATWCHKSRPKIEQLNSFASHFSGRNDIVFLAISVDELSNYDKLIERVKYKKLNNLSHAFSGNGPYDEALHTFRVDTLPQFFVISEYGEVISTGSSSDAYEFLLPQYS